jgi:hypothetical protein
MTTNTQQEMIKILEERGCTPIDVPLYKNHKVTYICKCGTKLTRIFKDFARRGCRYCSSTKLQKLAKETDEANEITKNKPEDTKEEIWKPVTGAWISSLGRAVNNLGVPLTLCKHKFRYRVNGKQQYASRLVAEAFKIPGYENLDDNKYVVSHKDKDPSNNTVDNVIIISKRDAVSNSVRSITRRHMEKSQWEQDKFKHMEYRTVPEFPDYKIYENGEIHNGKRFLTFTRSHGYYTLFVTGGNVKVHRLVCYAFHPILGLYNFDDYRGLQVNHKNGNTHDNSASNLEWCTGSENIKHAYDTKLNKKVCAVAQFDKKTGEFIAKYPSYATASKVTEEPVHRITASATGKPVSVSDYTWYKCNDTHYYLPSEKAWIAFVQPTFIYEE